MIKLNYAEYDSCSPDDKKKYIRRMVDKCAALGEGKVVVTKGNLYERFAKINRIDQAILEAEAEVEKGAEPISLDNAMKGLNKKHESS